MTSVLVKIASVFGRPDFNEKVLESWALISKGYFVTGTDSLMRSCRKPAVGNTAANRSGAVAAYPIVSAKQGYAQNILDGENLTGVSEKVSLLTCLN
jgi:hypothetical protein